MKNINKKMARVMFAAPKSGSGKTTITCGILKCIKDRGLKVSSFKCGPDYIDPIFHKNVIGIPAKNLDTFFTDEETTQALFYEQSKDMDISIIEGVMGYYDGIGGISTQASSYELAKVLATPVILVVDAKGSSLSILALIKGFIEYKKDANIKGVILNRISQGMYKNLKKEIEEQLSIKVYGYLPNSEELVIGSRHLGLKIDEIDDTNSKLSRIADACNESIDIDGIIKLANSAEAISLCLKQDVEIKDKDIRIAIAKDEAFCFYYEDNLKLLEKLGVELVEFSPIRDGGLPENIHGIYLGGGYPELYTKELSENKKMLLEIKKAFKNVPVIAECGGFMYLLNAMDNTSLESFEMVGALEGKATYTGKLSRFGYIDIEFQKTSLFGEAGIKFKGHEFHYYDTSNNGNAAVAKKPLSKRSWECIHVNNDYYAGFPHLYFYSNVEAIANFVNSCRSKKEENA